MADENVKRLVRALRNRTIRIGGGGQYSGNGILSGGGEAAMDLPLSENLTVSPYVNGGGAYGSVQTDQGKKKIRVFEPGGGLRLSYRF